jgi:hypothetical protein
MGLGLKEGENFPRSFCEKFGLLLSAFFPLSISFFTKERSKSKKVFPYFPIYLIL